MENISAKYVATPSDGRETATGMKETNMAKKDEHSVRNAANGLVVRTQRRCIMAGNIKNVQTAKTTEEDTLSPSQRGIWHFNDINAI